MVKELTIEATIENVDKAIEFINNELDAFGCINKTKTEISVAADEIFANIVNYAYEHKIGKATIGVEQKENPKAVVLTFVDNGVPFNPLEKEEPNTTLSAEERRIGGLGILIVKRIMDEVDYKFKDNQNILKITKYM